MLNALFIRLPKHSDHFLGLRVQLVLLGFNRGGICAYFFFYKKLLSEEELHDALNVFLDSLLKREDALVVKLALAEASGIFSVTEQHTQEIEPQERKHLLSVTKVLLSLLFIRLITISGDA